MLLADDLVGSLRDRGGELSMRTFHKWAEDVRLSRTDPGSVTQGILETALEKAHQKGVEEPAKVFTRTVMEPVMDQLKKLKGG